MNRKRGDSEWEEFIRVVTLRKGEAGPSEFMLRKGEKGLSLFANAEKPSPAEAIDAVRLMGKRGVLAAVSLKRRDIRNLGLIIVQTPGGTGNEEVNAIHFEARLPFFRRLWLRLYGTAPHEYFNKAYSKGLCRLAQLVK